MKVSRSYIDKMSANQLLSWFLISSYCYYRLSKPVMTDMDFDHLTQKLKSEWDDVDHPHKSLVTEDHLRATTGYDIKYPTIVRYSARDIIESEEKFE